MKRESLVRIGTYLFFGLLMFFIYRSYEGSSKQSSPISAEELNEQLSERKLNYSKHAKCRMECREISKEEVLQALHHGDVNWRKSDTLNDRCPRYALETRTEDNQEIRIIFAGCQNETVVVTAIDLKGKHDCYCP